MKKSQLFAMFCSVTFLFLIIIVPVQAGMIYAINDDTDRIVAINTSTFAITDIGALGIDALNAGLAYDSNSATMYLVNGGANNSGFLSPLYTINMGTGAASLIGNTNAPEVFGLAYDSLNNVLYGSRSGGTQYTISTTTGVATGYGVSGISGGGLAYNSLTDQLVGTDFNTTVLYEINRTTGTGTIVASGLTAGTMGTGFTYDPDQDLYWSTGPNLTSYDPSNAYSSTVHVSNIGNFSGLTYASVVPVPPALWLFGSGLFGLIGIARRKNAT